MDVCVFASTEAILAGNRFIDDRFQSFRFEAGTVHNRERRMFEQLPVVFPGGDLQKGVHSHDEIKGRAGTEFPPELFERFDGIGAARTPVFKVRSLEMRLPRKGQLQHVVAMVKGDLPQVFLVRRTGRRHEQNPVEVEALPYFLGRSQMAEVDGIECASKDAQLENGMLLL